MDQSLELPGLEARLDKLVYRYDPVNAPADRPHIFIYFITVTNRSDRTVTLLGRKWVLDLPDGARQVVEGDKIVGETPLIPRGSSFSYNSFHLASDGAVAQGSFHGCDEFGNRIWVRIPRFKMTIPSSLEETE